MLALLEIYVISVFEAHLFVVLLQGAVESGQSIELGGQDADSLGVVFVLLYFLLQGEGLSVVVLYNCD